MQVHDELNFNVYPEEKDTVLGIVTDQTTKGISDSELALTYDKPKGE